MSSFSDQAWSQIWLKCENLQNTGSFKIRGVANQFEDLRIRFKNDGNKEQEIVTMSAGNYGKSCAYAAQQLGAEKQIQSKDS